MNNTKQLLLSATYAIIDESGRFGDPDSRIIVLTAILTNSLIGLDQLASNLRKVLPTKGRRKRERTLSEIKFSLTGDKTRQRFLIDLAKQSIAILNLVINTEGRKVADTPQNYALLVASLLKLVPQRTQLQHLIIDRHFTWIYQQRHFNQLLQDHLNQNLFIEHLDSQQHSILATADFVAGAIRVAHTKHQQIWKRYLDSKILVEKEATWKELKQQKSKSFKGSGKTSTLLLLYL